ncbi:PREDICTED: uncharacterized protein LOC106804792 isoform X2 [Priapulus caudatus]|uniref:Uncharacterized protein LOC106804792 isoform X2 n=1 Tax=Priapulus caudatus TaxID=37621 RepID=A0ABM1DNV3_PRICU|nr:PREDICTED: uncharacterized protein LOC106804792 isoform X2 [Priapulus caudatus]
MTVAKEKCEMKTKKHKIVTFKLEPRASTYPVDYYVSELQRYVQSTQSPGSDSGTGSFEEESIHQGALLSTLLRKLTTDLKMAYSSFVEEFVMDERQGVSRLLDVLKQVHEEQGCTTANKKLHNKSLTDEHDCLLSLKLATRVPESIDQMVAHPGGMEEVTACLMSSFTKARTLALELLTITCSAKDGNTRVLESFTMFKFKFGESARFKMLVGMMSNPGYTVITFQIAALQMLNRLLDSAASPNMRVYLQQELEVAGLDLQQLQGSCNSVDEPADKVATLKNEVSLWKNNYIDVEVIADNMLKVNGDNILMKNKVTHLQNNLMALEHERVAVYRTEQDLRDECARLRLRLDQLESREPSDDEDGPPVVPPRVNLTGSASSRSSSHRGVMDKILPRGNSNSLTSLSTSSTHRLSSSSNSPGTLPKSHHKRSPTVEPDLIVTCPLPWLMQPEAAIKFNASHSVDPYIPVYQDIDVYAPSNYHHANGYYETRTRSFNQQRPLPPTPMKASKYGHDAGPYVPLYHEPPTYIPAPDYAKSRCAAVEHEIDVIESAFDGIDVGKRAFF